MDRHFFIKHAGIEKKYLCEWCRKICHSFGSVSTDFLNRLIMFPLRVQNNLSVVLLLP